MDHDQNIWRRLTSAIVGPSPKSRPRRPGGAGPQVDALEGRVVLSRIGPMGRAASAQVSRAAATSPTTAMLGGCHTPGVSDAQLATDLQTLRTDLDAAISGSAVTDAQRLALRADFRALSTAGVVTDKTALAAATDTLLTSIAAGTYDADAATIQATFTAAFTGPSGADLTTDQAAPVSTAYGDFVTVARNLNLSTEELTTLADDRAAIQADLTRLGLDPASGRFRQTSNLDLVLSPGIGVRGGRRGGRS